MGVKEMYELPKPRQRRSRTPKIGQAAIVVCQNVLLWVALYVAASTIYILVVGAVKFQDIPSRVMYLVASILSLLYLATQNVATHLRTNARSMIQHERVDAYHSLAANTLPILVTIWTVTSGLCITFTAARQPLCSSSTTAAALDQGNTCIIDRTTIVAGLVGVIDTIMLCLLRRHVADANRCYIFGVVPEDMLLPLHLSQKRRTLRAKPSEMSFKCRSSVSMASQATVTTWKGGDTIPFSAELCLPSQGLGIHTSRSSAPASLLYPRPSVSSIRSHTSLPLYQPPASPLPPLPVYLPDVRRATTAMHKAIHQPASFSRPIPIRPARSDDTLRILPPPVPAFQQGNLAVPARRPQSASSIYSRDTTGDSEIIPRRSPRPSLITSSRTSSSSSVATIKPSPLHEIILPKASQEEEEEPPCPSKPSDPSSEGPSSSSQQRRRRAHSLDSSSSSAQIPSHEKKFTSPPPAAGHFRKSSLPNYNAKLEEKLRRYAESQSQILRRGQMGSSGGGGGGGYDSHHGSKPSLMMQQASRGEECPERFRFE